MNEFQLSNKSKSFLENLRLYLFSSGKKSEEIDEIVEELEVHLIEAEKNGKSIEKIIGKSPKEYMEMVSNEMPVDYRTWIKYIVLIILGAFCIKIIPDLLEGNISYSVLEIAGFIVIGALFIATCFAGFKYISSTNQSLKKQAFILFIVNVIPIALFVGLIYLNRAIDTPVIHFGNTASLLIGVIASFVIIGMSIWVKSWLLIIIVALLTLPDYLLSLTSLKYDIQLMISSFITFGGFAVYIWVSSKVQKK